MKKWVKITDGTLALENTPMQIVYRRDGLNGSYRIYQDNVDHGSYMTLAYAKIQAEWIHDDLVEIGVV